MTRRLSILFQGAVLLPLLLASPVRAQSLPPIPEAARETAVSGIATLRQLSIPGEPSVMNDPVLGLPVRDFMIGLDPLRAYDGGDGIYLLRPTGQIFYPVLDGSRIVSQVMLMERGGAFTAFGFGPASEAQARMKAAVYIKSIDPAAEIFQVRIPALRVMFLGWKSGDNRVMLVPFRASPLLRKLQDLRESPAPDVLKYLQSHAKTVPDGRPSPY